MQLTQQEKEMLAGKQGKTVQKCMQILTKLGEIYGAERMIEVHNVHSPGVSYRVAGDAGLNYVVNASKEACFCVPTTLNTIGIDRENWASIGFDEEFSRQQLRLNEAYESMGAIPCDTCTPYLTGHLPLPGEHIAWGESSAIAFANSVLGARTNREGGPTALAAAVTGRVPAYGLHLEENRRGNLLVHVEVPIESDKDFAVLGYFCGKEAKNGIPVIEGITRRPSLDNFKTFSAAVASSGAVALYHIVGFTPEAPTLESALEANYREVSFTNKEYNAICEKFSQKGSIDFVVIGCPHASIDEFAEVAGCLGDGAHFRSGFWICTARQTKLLADEMGYSKTILEAGGEIICDTCPVLCCTLNRGYKTLATNSAKMAHYAPGLWGLSPALCTLEECVRAAVSGCLEE